MELLCSLISSALEVCFFGLFWQAFLKPRFTGKQALPRLLFLWAAVFICVHFCKNAFVEFGLLFLIFWAASPFMNTASFVQHGLVAALGMGITGIPDAAALYGISALLEITLETFSQRRLLHATVVSTGKLTEVFIAWVIYKLRSSGEATSIRKKWLLLSLVFPCASLAMLIVMFYISQQESGLSYGIVLFSCILAVTSIAMLYLIDVMEKSTQQSKENALLSQQMELQTEHILALEKSYRAQRQTTHDFRSQLQTISNLLEMGKWDVAKDYVQQLQDLQVTRIFIVNSRHPIIDAVLNHKYQAAKALGIDVQIQVNDLSGVTIPTDMLIVLLSNLLDNAIEGCQRTLLADQQIVCSLIAEESLQITIRNTALPVVIMDNTIPTSKEPKENHGYGLGRIRSILDELGAEYVFDYCGGWFTFAAEIPPV